MDACARVCFRQLRLHFFPGCEALLYVIQGNDIKRGPYTQAVLVPSTPNSPVAMVRVACCPPSHARDPVAKTRVRLNCCLQCVRSWVLGSANDCWAAEWYLCHASREGFKHKTVVGHMVPLPACKTYRPVP